MAVFKAINVQLIAELTKVPYNIIIILYDPMQGCSECCPFCNEPCEKEFKHSDNHSIVQHHPQCLAGSNMDKSYEMVMSICNVIVGSGKTFEILGKKE